MPEPARRIEVFTGGGPPRAWSAEEKARIIAESYAEGETVSGVARRHGLTPSQLFWWRRAALQAMAKKGCDGIVCAGDCWGGGEREAATRPGAGDAPESRQGRHEIIIGPALVRVSNGVDARMLSVVLAALKPLAA